MTTMVLLSILLLLLLHPMMLDLLVNIPSMLVLVDRMTSDEEDQLEYHIDPNLVRSKSSHDKSEYEHDHN